THASGAARHPSGPCPMPKRVSPVCTAIWKAVSGTGAMATCAIWMHSTRDTAWSGPPSTEPNSASTAHQRMNGPLEWFAAIGTILAAGMIAADLGRRVTGWAFILLVLISVAWVTLGTDK